MISRDIRPLRLETLWRETRGLMAARRGRLVMGLALMLVSRGAALVLPATSKYLFDDVIAGGRYELLTPLAAVAIVAGILQAASAFALAQVVGVAAHAAITDLRRRVQQHVIRLKTTYFDEQTSGALIARIMHDPEGIRSVIGTGIIQFAGSAITVAMSLAVMLYLNWSLTMYVAEALLLFSVVIAWAFRSLRPLYAERAAINSGITSRLAETLGGIRVVKAYARENREDLVFARGVHRNLRNVARTIFEVSRLNAFTTMLGTVIGVIILVAGARAVAGAEMTVGELVMYALFAGLLAAPLITVATAAAQLAEAFSGLERVRDVLQEPLEPHDDPERRPIGTLRGDLAFDGVSFEYQKGVPVLQNITFEMPAGTTTALVGPSGAGKTTMANLVLGFLQATSGRVLVDGRDLATLRLRDYRSRLGVILQEDFLFDGTVAENILYGRLDASAEEVVEAARLAHVDEFVTSLPEGFETVVGERGMRLSGGQRQRVAIARALVANPAILILDEATSSLDSASEARIQEALAAVRKGRTTLVIAHRLSTIRCADQIVVLDGGRIVGRGRHGELMAQCRLYRDIYRQQHRLEMHDGLSGQHPSEVVTDEDTA